MLKLTIRVISGSLKDSDFLENIEPGLESKNVP